MDEQPVPMRVRWRWGGFAALAMMILASYPQLHFWVVRGSQWNGSYAAIEGVGDEIAYSAYVNALIEGRPRKNDPYTGRASRSGAPQRDSLFSIQFVPAYLIALPAKTFGISAATAFILLSPLAAGAAALALFWLLTIATGNDRLSAAGVIVVLCLGTLVGGHGYFSSFFGEQPLYDYLMFLRRYQPAATFPLFLTFCAFFLLSLISLSAKRRIVFAVIAALFFALLVFSYVYLWTAAAAWVVSLLWFWLLAKPAGWRPGLRSFVIVGAGALIALSGFVIAFSNRAASMDSVQALELSHAPDITRLPALLGILVLVALAVLASRNLITLRDRPVLWTASFAFLPLVVFNQQIVTGHSLQPLHYEMFVANYSALIAVVILGSLIANQQGVGFWITRKGLIWIALLAFEWGSYETLVATRGSMDFDHELDNAKAVAARLLSIGTVESQRRSYPTILSTDLLVADSLPSTAPQGVLWAPHMLVFSGVSNAEAKERFYQYLYYTGIKPDRLRSILRDERRYGFAVGLFGFERTIRGLSKNPKPITDSEVETEIKSYSAYSASFDRQQANKVPISFVVARKDEMADFAQLDRWYERDQGELVGNFVLYRTRLREGDSASTLPSTADDNRTETSTRVTSRAAGE